VLLLNEYKYRLDMLSFLRSFVTRIVFREQPTVILGRWALQYDQRMIDCKVFQANEDHCGCCSSVATVSVVNNVKVDEKEDDYLVPYVIEA
jgi:hypothetical protein